MSKEQNICTVPILEESTIETNVLVEDNGQLKRLNLELENGKLKEEINNLNTQVYNMGNLITELEAQKTDLKNQVTELNSKLEYYSEDVITLKDMIVPALLTTSATELKIGIHLPKMLKSTTNMKITSLVGGFRLPTGGYLDSGSDAEEWITKDKHEFKYIFQGNNSFSIIIKNHNIFNATNNIPLVGNIQTLQITCA